ncbi:putative holin-like toxin [Mesorhizobium sp. M00.F.Ca.ET.186.01.1.1]|nr:putative holin-like toxin [Mesorhizobium sp. M00.F.Ca.ET.186.01.1.1]
MTKRYNKLRPPRHFIQIRIRQSYQKNSKIWTSTQIRLNLEGGRLISPRHKRKGGGIVAITHETLSLMLQFGGFVVGLLSLVVAIVVALYKRNDRP